MKKICLSLCLLLCGAAYGNPGTPKPPVPGMSKGNPEVSKIEQSLQAEKNKNAALEAKLKEAELKEQKNAMAQQQAQDQNTRLTQIIEWIKKSENIREVMKFLQANDNASSQLLEHAVEKNDIEGVQSIRWLETLVNGTQENIKIKWKAECSKNSNIPYAIISAGFTIGGGYLLYSADTLTSTKFVGGVQALAVAHAILLYRLCFVKF